MNAAATGALQVLTPGTTPLLINVPHGGYYIPPTLGAAMTPVALTSEDTDWHVGLLYQFALLRGAGLMVATHSRYVVDLNRDPAGRVLYPGADNSELCPTLSFANEPLYREGQMPDVDDRRRRYWAPYHATLDAELQRLRQIHGYAVLLDAHSIRAEVPRFFPGRLPDLNLGTADGRSCAASLQALAAEVLAGADGFTHVVNGRFKGGYITRHYGQPADGIQALQLEMAQDRYMNEAPPFAWDPHRARSLIEVLDRLVAALLSWTS